MNEESLIKGWKLAKLSELGEVNRGRSRHRPRYAEHLYGGPYPFIQTGDIRTSGGRIISHSTTYSEAGLAQSRLWPAGTMCITIAANIAETAILTYPACFPDSVVGFVADPKHANVRFVEYAFRLLKRRLQQEAMGSVQDNINLEVLSRLQLPIPSLVEQEAIAAVLGALDDKIEQNRRTSRALEGLARATFKAWFVDFEPVKAKAAGAASFPDMPDATFAALPDSLTESQIGPVPQGWAVRCLEDVAEASKGLSYKGAGLVCGDDEEAKDALPLHNLNSVYEGGGYKNEGLKRYRGDYKERHLLLPGDLIVANTEQGHEYRLIGFPAIVPKRYGERGLFSHHIFRVRPLSDSPVSVQWLYQAMMSGRIREEITGCTNGTTVNMLSIDGLKRPRLCLPPADLAAIFEQRASAMHELSESLVDESFKLAALRDYLLPRLLSGRVRVRPSQGEIKA